MRRSTSVSMDRDLLDEAKALGVNISRSAEAGIAAAVRKARGERWREENAAAFDSANKWVEDNGLPFETLQVWP